VRAFFSEIEFALGAATLVVSRSGASTLAEIAAMRLPSILVPFPHAADNHQYLNAAAFANSGAALLLEQSTPAPIFAREVLRLATNPLRREAMGTALQEWHAPDAASRIARRIIEVASIHHPQLGVQFPQSQPSSFSSIAPKSATRDTCLTR
jgi:UDP-N-acetylglucosamine--N-acetylmuramyl-(pentapeptide) pyrophosphoryl-undecaprenol N-acetylglucosamine transferase